MDITLVKGESVVLLVDPRDTRDKGWILSDDIYRVEFNLRESETADVLLTAVGGVEKIGESVDDPGKVAIPLYWYDLKDLATGTYYYDVVLFQKGHQFDIADSDGLYVQISAGKVRVSAGDWTDIDEGWLALADDTVNFIELTAAGVYALGSGAYTGGMMALYRVITADGEVMAEFPGDTWFEEDASNHLGLDFAYLSGWVLNADGDALVSVDAGTVTLKAGRTNFIEVNSAGVVSANITRFTAGAWPLFAVDCDADSITDVEAQQTDLFTALDDREDYLRGDMRVPTVKKQCVVTWTPGQPEDEEGE